MKSETNKKQMTKKISTSLAATADSLLIQRSLRSNSTTPGSATFPVPPFILLLPFDRLLVTTLLRNG